MRSPCDLHAISALHRELNVHACELREYLEPALLFLLLPSSFAPLVPHTPPLPLALPLQVLPTFTRSFVQETETSSPEEGATMDDWLKGVTVNMQGSIEKHLQKVFRENA